MENGLLDTPSDSVHPVVALVLAQSAERGLDLVGPGLDEVVVSETDLAVAAHVGVNLGDGSEELEERGLGSDPRSEPGMGG